jgi:glycosyltransferase involved in cell wall biosynthesis
LSREYDVVLMSDLRYPGGSSASLAEEIKAQAAAGYTTALMHVPAAHMQSPRAFNRGIARCLHAGLADLVPADREVTTRVLIVRQPQVLAEELPVWPRIRAGVTVLVVNQPPVDAFRTYYDVAAVRERAAELFGSVLWAPIGPAVRDALAGAPVELRTEDWVNVLDPAEWRSDRSRFRADRPVIGRHSRGDAPKWPAAAADILAAYPDDPAVRVRVLGGAGPALRLLGRRPANWEVLPFGALPPAEFLAGIDFFVYFHHPGWIEAFGRSAIEAMASGAPAIVPPRFEALLGDAALYRRPAEVRETVEGLYRDPAAYREASERGRAFVDERFGAAAHVRRLRGLIDAKVPG